MLEWLGPAISERLWRLTLTEVGLLLILGAICIYTAVECSPNCAGSIVTSARCETTRTGYGPEPNEHSLRQT
jgi:hypothetical protein